MTAGTVIPGPKSPFTSRFVSGSMLMRSPVSRVPVGVSRIWAVFLRALCSIATCDRPHRDYSRQGSFFLPGPKSAIMGIP